MKKAILLLAGAVSSVCFGDVVVGNAKFTLTIGDDAVPKSLVVKATGEEMLAPARGRPFFSITQERPFNNEVKLSYPNARTTYRAKSVKREGDVLRVAFKQAQYEALVKVQETDSYVAFTLTGFDKARDAYSYLKLDCPPASEFRLLELPVRTRPHLGEWLNVMWDDRNAVAVIASSVNELISQEKRDDGALLIADAYKSVKMQGATAILIASETPDFLDCVEQAEIGFDMPRGVASRRSKEIAQSTLCTFVCPTNVDEVVAMAKKGGFKNLHINYTSIVKEGQSWCLCGDYDFREEYPNGYEDLRKVLDKVKAAGLCPGLHILMPHIGMQSRYVTPVADHRLGLTRHYTLAKRLAPGNTFLEVEEDAMKAPEFPNLRVLRFGGELMTYAGRTATRPYRFTGLVRGAFGTRVTDHPAGEIGGVLDVSEYGGSNYLGSCYLDMDSSLADEVSEKIAKLCDCGMEFLYMDGSEGVKAPYGHYVALAQLKVWEKLKTPTKFAQGAAKSHFSWHILSGANAYDQFAPHIFERDTAIYPVEGAKIMANDFSHVDFGWWGIVEPYAGVHNGTRPEMWEWGFKLATAYDAPVTVQCRGEAELRSLGIPIDELLAVSRRWLDAREKGFFTPEMKERLKDTSVRHHLTVNAAGEYELKELPRGEDPTCVRKEAPAAKPPQSVTARNPGLVDFGVAYYPEAWPEERWETDLAMMEELGINLIRIGEFNWSNFEPTEGVFDFAPYLRLLDMCEKHGIKVMMCTPTAAIPKWMERDWPATLKTRADGSKPECGIRQTACTTSKDFRRFSRRVTEKMAEAFKDHPAVTTWQLDNEISIMGATGVCVCNECRAAYIADLRKRYGTLENLNKEFNGVFWSDTFTKWDDVRLPFSRTRGAWCRDYLRFRGEQDLAVVLEQAEILRKANPKWRITSNNPSSANFTRMDTLFGNLGYASVDTYVSSDKEQDFNTTMWQWTMYRGLTGVQKPFMVGESGPFCFDTTIPHSFDLVKPWLWLSVLHGAESFVYFRWRESVGGEETHGAVVPWSGKRTFVYDLLKRNMEEFRSLPESLARQPLEKGDIAIIHDADSHTYALTMAVNWKCSDVAEDAPVALLSALERRGVRTDIVQLRDDVDLSSYKVVFLPNCLSVSEAFQKNLRAYVEKGGVIVAADRLNYCSPLGAYTYPETGPKGMTDLFGIDIDERRSLRGESVAELAVPTTAETLLAMDDTCFKGKPLLTRNAFGTGAAYYFTRLPEGDLARRLVREVLGREGVPMREELPALVRRMSRGPYTVIVNFMNEPVELPAEPGEPLLGAPAAVEGGRIRVAPHDVVVYERSDD